MEDKSMQSIESKPDQSSAPERIRGVYARLIATADVMKKRREARILQGSTKLPGQAPCPCGSGRKYKNCCRTK
jgi:uncharacterized protein YecA (UPF0149 family)